MQPLNEEHLMRSPLGAPRSSVSSSAPPNPSAKKEATKANEITQPMQKKKRSDRPGAPPPGHLQGCEGSRYPPACLFKQQKAITKMPLLFYQ